MSAKILVVDDYSVVCDVVSRMLSLLGHKVSSADSGENGLSIFLENIFDIVLSDYEMPGMDGVAVACRVKRNAPHAGGHHDGRRKGDRRFQKEHRGGPCDYKAIHPGGD